MSNEYTVIFAFVLLFLLIFLGLPVAFSFAIVGFLGIWLTAGISAALVSLPVTIYQNLTNYTLTCIPLFVLMGIYSYYSNLGPDLYNGAIRWWGRLPGGLAITTVWGCCLFGAATGSSTAGVLTFTPIAYKPMLDLGYDKRLASGCIISGATMGSIIPPSLTFILYAAVTDESVGKLLIAGIFPGILEAIFYSIIIFISSITNILPGPPSFKHYSCKEKFEAFKNIWPIIILILLVIGSIYLGIATPTEASAVGAFGALIFLIFRRGFNFKIIFEATKEGLVTSSMILFIIVCSLIFSNYLALTGVSKIMVTTITSAGISPYWVLIAFIGLMLIAGCVMPATPMILLFVPVFYPILVKSLRFDGIWFGVLVAILTEIALITPPIGLNLFAFESMIKGDISKKELYIGVLPFVISDLIRVCIIIIFPAIVLWLPSKMFAS